MSRGGVLVILAAALAGAACTTLLGTDLTSDDASGTDAAGDAPGDSSGDGASGGGGDAGGGTSDADGGGDPAAAGDGACPGTFCDDFDDSNLGQHWSTQELDDGGTLEYVTSDPVSAPNALHSLVDTRGAQHSAGATLYKNFISASKVECSVFVKVLARPNEFADVLSIHLDGQDGSSYTFLYYFNQISDGVREDVHAVGGSCECPRDATQIGVIAIDHDAWHELEVTLDIANQTETIKHDGTIVSNATGYAVFPAAVGATLRIGLGLEVPENNQASAAYDDFVCTVTP